MPGLDAASVVDCPVAVGDKGDGGSDVPFDTGLSRAVALAVGCREVIDMVCAAFGDVDYVDDGGR